jgi:hypothetical protein
MAFKKKNLNRLLIFHTSKNTQYQYSVPLSSSGAHLLFSGEFFSHRRSYHSVTPSLSQSGEAIPPSLPLSLSPAKLLSPSLLSLSLLHRRGGRPPQLNQQPLQKNFGNPHEFNQKSTDKTQNQIPKSYNINPEISSTKYSKQPKSILNRESIITT